MTDIPSDISDEHREFSEFLRSHPLHTLFTGQIPSTKWGLYLPIYVHLFCSRCSRETAFQTGGGLARQSSGGGPALEPPPASVAFRERTQQIEYECVTCRGGKYVFYVHFTEGLKECQKIGQSPPPWEDTRDERLLVKFLPRQKDLWRRGRYCEMSGLGLAANAYYRHLLEDSALEILERLVSIMPDEDRATLGPTVKSLVKQKKVSDLLKIVQDSLPLHLKKRGVENALVEMYEIMSSNIHAGIATENLPVTEMERTEEAKAIRNMLVFLLTVISTGQEEIEAFEDGVKRLRKIREKHVASRGSA